jgi:hypothetical protein
VAHDDLPGSTALTGKTAVEERWVFPRRALITGLACALTAGAAARLSGQSVSGTYHRLEIAVSGVTCGTNVSLTDCPAGANSVRGVIRPGDANEFASVTLDFTVQPAFTPAAAVPSPMLYDDTGQGYKTAQAFGEMAAGASFSCTFSYRVPKGRRLARLAIGTLSLDLGKSPQR